jgi:hypothetical protein
MFKKLLGAAAVTFALAVSAGSASAAVNLNDLPSDTYITVGKLDWTWASPVASPTWYGANTLYGPELHKGWRYATASELANRPNASAFVINGQTVQSVQYWNSSFTHIDFNDGVNGLVSSAPDGSYNETWYVRDVAAVPEPATWAMMIIGFGGVGSMVRSSSRRRALVTA